MKLTLLILCVVLLFAPIGAMAAPEPPRLTFETSAVVGSGFTPGRQVVLYGCANVPQPYYRRMLSFLNVVTADASGSFRWEAPEAISPYSVWFAIGSGPADEVVAIPGRSTPPVSRLAPPRLLVGRDAGDDALAINEDMDDVLVVRPNDTVWIGTAVRHGASDLNRRLPGVLAFSTKTLHAKATLDRAGNATGTSVNHINPSDVVVLINPTSLAFYIGRLSPN